MIVVFVDLCGSLEKWFRVRFEESSKTFSSVAGAVLVYVKCPFEDVHKAQGSVAIKSSDLGLIPTGK